jgi:predicted TIM-barrel fold metal-dependent hydrolase
MGMGAQRSIALISIGEYHPQIELRNELHTEIHPKHPVIDMHAHFGALLFGENYEDVYDTQEVVENLKRAGIRRILSLELEWEDGYDRLAKKLEASKGFVVPIGSVDVSKAQQKDFECIVYRQIRDLKRKGCKAVKLWKDMTLFSFKYFGNSVGLDAPCYQVIWQACAEEHIPIIMHVADPTCFFQPIDENNENYVCLHLHPEWSFYGLGLPSFEEHMVMQENVIRSNPNTTFIIAHVGSYAENLKQVGQWLKSYPNMYVDVAARLGQLGRQPYTARKFFLDFSDRILFGTDFEARFSAKRTAEFYLTHYRFFETYDEYFEHPFQDMLGQWRIYGLGLPDDVLEKFYYKNSERVLGL